MEERNARFCPQDINERSDLCQSVSTLILPLQRVSCWHTDDRKVLRQGSQQQTTREGNLRQSVCYPIPLHPCVKQMSFGS
ncbi:CLUMA_CG016702, isoform A [Clunio marinus]|uniref:CLUMA_CG016702, isoform A n=1 Tax=Clunio marinus TaxID=568069 RepID=A0A1J1IW56_9DIPT|nr:CLUMA_CG016702, isoform A [Clunio marinus]